jgi:hypothetical protein
MRHQIMKRLVVLAALALVGAAPSDDRPSLPSVARVKSCEDNNC